MVKDKKTVKKMSLVEIEQHIDNCRKYAVRIDIGINEVESLVASPCIFDLDQEQMENLTAASGDIWQSLNLFLGTLDEVMVYYSLIY
jgi:hypothetical protein